MGDLDTCKGNLTEEECLPSINPFPTSIDVSIMGWDKFDLRTRELIYQIQPTIISENQRKVVVQYVQCLVLDVLDVRFFIWICATETYLSDGDIDLTSFSQHK
jgi:hypothetical protein